MKYSFNRDREGVVFASMSDINASFKDLSAVGTAIRYRRVPVSLQVLDEIIASKRAVEYRRYNAHMGSRHELGGKKGRFPKKCAALVKKVLVNAAANASAKGLDPEGMFVIHFAANKTNILRRGPSKGNISWGRGMYGPGSYRRSDLEMAKIEIGIANDANQLGEKAQSLLKRFNPEKVINRQAPKKTVQPKPKATAADKGKATAATGTASTNTTAKVNKV